MKRFLLTCVYGNELWRVGACWRDRRVCWRDGSSAARDVCDYASVRDDTSDDVTAHTVQNEFVF